MPTCVSTSVAFIIYLKRWLWTHSCASYDRDWLFDTHWLTDLAQMARTQWSFVNEKRRILHNWVTTRIYASYLVNLPNSWVSFPPVKNDRVVLMPSKFIDLSVCVEESGWSVRVNDVMRVDAEHRLCLRRFMKASATYYFMTSCGRSE